VLLLEHQRRRKPPNRNRCLLIGVENVRGMSNFQTTYEQLMAQVLAMVRDDRVIVVFVIDHDSKAAIQVGSSLPSTAVVVFAGHNYKADDVIVELIQQSCSYPHNYTSIQVVTADSELIQRCSNHFGNRKKPKNGRAPRHPEDSSVEFVGPISVLDGLVENEESAALFPQLLDNLISSNHDDLDTAHLLQQEVAARQELQLFDRLSHEKNRKVLEKRRRRQA
jgi:hypothetical protein